MWVNVDKVEKGQQRLQIEEAPKQVLPQHY